MTSPSDSGGLVTFTTKEMLARLDGKLDTLIGHIGTHDIRLTLVEKRARDAESIAKEVRDQIGGITRRIAYASGAVGAIILVAEILLSTALHRL